MTLLKITVVILGILVTIESGYLYVLNEEYHDLQKQNVEEKERILKTEAIRVNKTRALSLPTQDKKTKSGLKRFNNINTDKGRENIKKRLFLGKNSVRSCYTLLNLISLYGDKRYEVILSEFIQKTKEVGLKKKAAMVLSRLNQDSPMNDEFFDGKTFIKSKSITLESEKQK